MKLFDPLPVCVAALVFLLLMQVIIDLMVSRTYQGVETSSCGEWRAK